jgi:3-dehydroquinate synthase
MKTIEVKLSHSSYGIKIGPGLLSLVGEQLTGLGFRQKVVIVTNPAIKDLYGNMLEKSATESVLSPIFLEVPEGEQNKSLEWAGKLYTQLIDIQVERTTPILALGGGVIGDLAGFVAATYMRGVPLVHVPTTLLAQVDSSIGGKTAVNHGSSKNMIGAFYQPGLVLDDISTLRSLPEKEIENGLAETIKYGIIRDKGLFELIESNILQIKKLDEKLIEEIVFRCAAIKAEVVEKDEKDTGLRNILNYGHTVGHAVETVSKFKIKHGEAVAIGMVAAGMISNKMGLLPASELYRIKSVIIKAGLPAAFWNLDVTDILQAMTHDKKRVAGKMRMVLNINIGEVILNDDVSTQLVEQVLKEMYEEAQDLRHNS